MSTTQKPEPRVQAKPEPASDIPRSPLINLWDWRAANPHLFPSDTSLRWHLRKHRATYVTSGALMELCGRHVCDPVKMEITLRQVGQRVAAERGTERAEVDQ